MKLTSILQILKYTMIMLTIWVVLAQCLIMKGRWSDAKATKVFTSKQVPLNLYDTIIGKRHIHYAVSGNDSLPLLVFLHGSPGSWFHYMKFMWDSSMRSRFSMVAIDRPGFGYSNFGKAMHLQEQANLIAPVLQQLKRNRPLILCGHSYGGPLVAKIAADHPQLADKIVIVAGALAPFLESKETWRKIMNVRPLYWLLPGAFGPSNTELLYLKNDLVPLGDDLSKITTNVQFIHGDKDTWVPIRNVKYGIDKMINAASIRSDTIKGADHQVPWKNKDEMIRLLIQSDSVHPGSFINNVQVNMPEGKLTFMSTRDGNFEIYSMSLHCIAFHGKTSNGNYDIFLMNTDGSNLTNLTGDEMENYSPSWSPDGKWIAYTGGNSNNYDVWIIHLVSHIKYRLTSHPKRDESPIWEPAL
jgi:pimeloyl-ACP methyl ester carboxylesterase